MREKRGRRPLLRRWAFHMHSFLLGAHWQLLVISMQVGVYLPVFYQWMRWLEEIWVGKLADMKSTKEAYAAEWGIGKG